MDLIHLPYHYHHFHKTRNLQCLNLKDHSFYFSLLFVQHFLPLHFLLILIISFFYIYLDFFFYLIHPLFSKLVLYFYNSFSLMFQLIHNFGSFFPFYQEVCILILIVQKYPNLKIRME